MRIRSVPRPLYPLILSFHLLLSKRYYWGKVFILSSIIMSIALVNYVVKPLEWHELVGPYASASYSVEIPANFIYFVNTSYGSLSLGRLVRDLVRMAEARGAVIQDYVVAYELQMGDHTYMVLSNISKCSLTPYCHVVMGRRPRSINEALVPSFQPPHEKIGSPGDVIRVEDKAIRIVGAYSKGSDIVLAHQVFLPGDEALSIPAFRYPWYLYLETSKVDEGFWASVIRDLLMRYNRTGVIRLTKSPDDLVSRPSSWIALRSEDLESVKKFFNQQYSSLSSPFTLFWIGGLVVFVAYMVKVALDILAGNMDLVGMLYAIGAKDREVLLPLTLLYLYHILPPIVMGIITCGLVAQKMWGYIISLRILSAWVAPLPIGSLALSVVVVFLVSLVYVRGTPLSRVLAEEF